MADDTIRRRAACDRCHSQKIRCPRKTGQDVCDRCQKARTPCIFSPFRQKKIPEEETEIDESSVVSPGQSSLDQSDAISDNVSSSNRKRQRVQSPIAREASVNFNEDLLLGGSAPINTSSQDEMEDWLSTPCITLPPFQNFPDPTFDDLNLSSQTPFLPLDFSEIQARKEVNLDRSIKNTSNLADCLPPQPQYLESMSWTRWGQKFEVLEPHSETDCIRKLSQLSSDLFVHGNTIPPLTIFDPPPANVGDDGVWYGGQHGHYANYRVDETFRLTQALVDIYPTFLNAFLVSNTNFETAQNFSGSSTASSQAQALRNLDHSSILLILSCHLRLINIYEALFKHMKLCFDQGGVAKTPEQSSLDVPQLKIGTYAPPPSAAIPMQMLLLVQFASRLFHYAADLASEIGEPEQGTPLSDSSGESPGDDTLALTRAAAKNVKSRASKMSQELGVMRTLVLQMGNLA